MSELKLRPPENLQGLSMNHRERHVGAVYFVQAELKASLSGRQVLAFRSSALFDRPA
jgi:hypothetical protein